MKTINYQISNDHLIHIEINADGTATETLHEMTAGQWRKLFDSITWKDLNEITQYYGLTDEMISN